MATYSSIPAYTNSSFLKGFWVRRIGWLYAITSGITIFLMLLTPRLIKRFGNKNILIALVGLSILSVIPLAFPTLKSYPQFDSFRNLYCFGLFNSIYLRCLFRKCFWRQRDRSYSWTIYDRLQFRLASLPTLSNLSRSGVVITWFMGSPALLSFPSC